MRNRITWQNVAAPSFRDALAGVRQAGDAFSEGFENLAGIAGDIRQRQKEAASADAITRALGITDPTALAEAVSSGEFYDPRDLTADALNFFTNQRGSLLQDQQTIASTAGTRARTAQTQYNLSRARERDPILDARSDQNWADSRVDREFQLAQRERTVANQTSADAAAEVQAQAVQIADQVTNNSLNREEAKQQVIQQNLPPELEEAALNRIETIDPAQWAVNDLTRQAVAQDPTNSFGTLTEGLDSRRAEANLAFSTNENLRLYNDSLDRFEGSSSPILDVIESRFQGKEESPELNESRNSIKKSYDRLARDYDLPPEVIANVLDQTMKSGGFLSGGKLEIDMSAARQRLDAMNSPEARNRLESGRQKFKREQKRVDNFQGRMENLLERAALARRNNDVSAYRNAMEAVDNLREEFSEWSASKPASDYRQYEAALISGSERRSARTGR